MFPTYIFSSQPFTSAFIPSNNQNLYSSNSPGTTPTNLLQYAHSQSSATTQQQTPSDASSPQEIHHFPACYQYQPTYILSHPILAATGAFIGAPMEFLNRQEEIPATREINPNIDQTPAQPQETEATQTEELRAANRARYAVQDMEDLEEVHLMRPALQRNSKKIKKPTLELPKLPEKAERTLKRWFMQNYYDPYPNSIERTTLAKECKIDIADINAWFKKARQIQAKIPCKFSIEIERRLLNQMQEQRL